MADVRFDVNAWATMNDDKHLDGCFGQLTDAKCCAKENILLQKCSHINSTKLRKLGKLKFTYYAGNLYPPESPPILTEYQSDLVLVNKHPNGVTSDYTTVITGYIKFPVAKKYRFKMFNDDGASLLIGGEIIKSNPGYTPEANATISLYKDFTTTEYEFLAYVKQGTGGQGINIKINSEDMGDTFVYIPPSWLSSDFTMDLYKARSDGIKKTCGTRNDWWTVDACMTLIKDSTEVLNDYSQKIINVCKGKTNAQIKSDTTLCNPFYNSNVENDAIKKSYCSVNENYLTDSKCNNILTIAEKQPLYDKYCITDKNYKINYTKCDDFYSATNSNSLNDLVLSDCTGVNTFNDNCKIMGAKDRYKAPITAAIDTYCKENIDTTGANMNTPNCTNYVSDNIGTYNDLLTSYCEKDLVNLEKDVCKKIYSSNLNDDIVQNSKNFVDKRDCLADNKFTTDATCTELSKKEENKKYFIESAANFCRENMGLQYCTDFYRDTVAELKTACTSAFSNKKENFDNYDNDNDGCYNNLYLFLLFLVIIIIACTFPSYSGLKSKNISNNTTYVENKKI